MSNFVHVAADDSNPAASVGVQSWSRGVIFPAIISVVEEYAAPMSYDRWLAANSQLAHHDAHIIRAVYNHYVELFMSQSLDERIISRQYVLSLAGWNDAPFASYDEAHAEALVRLAYVAEEESEAAYWNSRRVHFAYSPEQIAAGEMAGGSAVPNRIGRIAH